MIRLRVVLNAPPGRTSTPARAVRHTSGPRADDRHPRASAACQGASRASRGDRGHPAGPRRRPGRGPGPGRPVRRAQPHLRPCLAGRPRRSRSVLGGLDDLRPVRGRHVHRAVRLLAGPRPSTLGVAVQVDGDVRAPAGLAHPAALRGRSRIQSGDDLVRARPARLAGATGDAGQVVAAAGEQGRSATAGRSWGARRASGPRNQAGERCRPADLQPVAGRARPATGPGPTVPPGPGGSAARFGSC